MDFITLAQCGSGLNFYPIVSYSDALPIYVYKSERLCAFMRNVDDYTDGCLQLKDSTSAFDVFISIYQKLTLPELARLQNNSLLNEWEWNLEKLYAHYGFRWNEQMQNISSVLYRSPLEFQNWVSIKGLGLRDLIPLTQAQLSQDFLIHFSNRNFSRSDGVQILEWATEICLMQKALPKLANENFLEQLRQTRYPMRSAADALRREKAARLSWPKGSDYRWNTQGDTPELEFRSQWKSRTDLDKCISALTHIRAQMDISENDPWT